MADPIETKNETNPLELSDADFLNMVPPTGNPIPTEEVPVADAAGADVVDESAAPKVDEDPADDELPAEPAPGTEGQDPLDKPAGEENPEGDPAPAKTQEGQEKPKEAEKPEGAVPPIGSKPEAELKAKEGEAPKTGEAEPLNFAAIGEMIMKPFKANGEMLQLKSPEEALKLMQMGAHFTRKMQAIQPHRKVLTMLENNGLLDEDRLSFLIDLEKKNPDAIKKLIKDSGIDPLEIDTTVEPTYRAGSHKVTDAEVNFKTALEDITSTPEGKEALKHFNETWDDASKEVVWADPSLLSTMHSQKQNGIYDRIEAEVSRRRTLGTIGPETSFIAAYQVVGTELDKSGAFADIAAKNVPSPSVKAEVPPAVTPVATRTATPKADTVNNDKAAAASPSRSGNRPAKPIINPLDMSDEDFAKLPLPVGKALN